MSILLSARSLRIGNWVLDCCNELYQINKNSFETIHSNDLHVFGIELNQKLVNKLSTANNRENYYFEKLVTIYDDALYQINRHEEARNIIGVPMIYLHHLQNRFYSLYNTELIINKEDLYAHIK